MKTSLLSSLSAPPPSLVVGLRRVLQQDSRHHAPAGTGDGGGGKRKIVIGFVGKSLTNDVFQAAAVRRARTPRATSGAKYNVDVELEVRTPNDEDATKQAEAVEALTRRGSTASRFPVRRPTRSRPPSTRPSTKAWPSCASIPTRRRASVSRTTARTTTPAARASIDELAKAMGEKGTVAILAGNQSAPNLQARVAGAKEALAKYPNMKLNDPGVFYHVETPEKAAEAVANGAEREPRHQRLGDDRRLAAVHRRRAEVAAGHGEGRVRGRAARAAQLPARRPRAGAARAGLLRLGGEVGRDAARQDRQQARRRPIRAWSIRSPA